MRCVVGGAGIVGLAVARDLLAGGAWCAEDGYFDRPQSVVEAFAHGIDVRLAEVRALDKTAAGWRVGDLDADAVVVAAGTETRTLLAPLGIDLPVVAEDRFLF